MTQTAYFENSRWLTAAILKIVNTPYPCDKSSDFDEILYTLADYEPDDSRMTKNANLWA